MASPAGSSGPQEMQIIPFSWWATWYTRNDLSRGTTSGFSIFWRPGLECQRSRTDGVREKNRFEGFERGSFVELYTGSIK